MKSSLQNNPFIIRVYGIIINNNNQVLLSDEFMLGTKMTKFPGGGLNYGEGPVECIKREAVEEFGQEIEIIEHFYTTDFFQESYFHKNSQVVSIYYRVRFRKEIKFKISDKAFDFHEFKDGNMSFRWKNIKDLLPEDLSFPIDKKVAGLIIKKFTRIK